MQLQQKVLPIITPHLQSQPPLANFGLPRDADSSQSFCRRVQQLMEGRIVLDSDQMRRLAAVEGLKGTSV
jgi:hypothetical protein